MTDDIPTPIPIDEPLADRIVLATERFGEARVIELALGLLQGRNEGEEILLYLGGRHAQGILDGAPALYWPEVWGARALGYVWDDSAASIVLANLRNQAWRVREMCTKVSAARGLDAAEAIAELLTDEVARVRSSAAKALGELGTASDEDKIRMLLRDPDKDVRRVARDAVRHLTERLGEKA